MPTKRTTKAPTTAAKPMKIDMYVAYRHGERDSWAADLSYAEAVDRFQEYNSGMPDEVVVVSINLNADGLTPEQRLRRFEVSI